MDVKKIAILCNYELLSTRVGGMDYFFWQFDAKCKENNIQVDWFFPNTATHGDYPQLTIIDCKYQPIESYFLEYCVLNNPSYSSIVTHFIALCTPFFKKLKQLSSAKVIAVDHNPRPINGYPIKKKIEKRLKGLLFSKHIDLFVGVSQYTKTNILADFGNHLDSKTIVVYNGIEFRNFKVREHRNLAKPTFLVACHLRESKGIQDLVEAVNLLPSNIKTDIRIDIYGDGEYKRNLQSQILKYNLSENFVFKGSVNNLFEIYYLYDYLIQPTHMECFSLSILESLYANVPVITTAVGGNEEVINHLKNGLIFNPKDINALQLLLQGVYEGEISIEENTSLLVKNTFSIDQMVNNHFDVLA